MIYNILLVLYFLGTVIGLWFVFKKAGEAPWKAVVPFYNIVVWIKLCGKSWRWYVYMLLPAVNIFCFLLLVTDTAKVMRRYGFWEQLAAVLFPWIYLPLVGLSPCCVYHDPVADPPRKVSEARDWLDAIVFAVVAAVIIRGNVFELYQIPSSSMEKSLLVGDHLLVSKMAYGPRVMMTPLSVPLVHNSIFGKDSYIGWPQLPYHRFPGYTEVQRFDAVVFNFPAGDTILSAFPGCQVTYYQVVQECGRDSVLSGNAVTRNWYEPTPVGEVRTRPLDKRENYIKRCVGLPGDTLQVIDHVVYIDGKPIETPKDAQTSYFVVFDNMLRYPQKTLHTLGVSNDDIEDALRRAEPLPDGMAYALPLHLTDQMVAKLRVRRDVLDIVRIDNPVDPTLFPTLADTVQSIDNYGPVHIPAKGEVLQLDERSLPMYRRLIETYEGNSLEVRDGRIFINGTETTTYTTRQNYYWMMGDSRHNSQDCRCWGYVPEDHISGKAKWVLWSWDKDKSGLLKFRNRFFNNANAR